MTDTGRIVKGFGELYTVLTDDKNSVDCGVRGSLKHFGAIPLVGDLVKFEESENGRPTICEIIGRKNSLIRPPIANLDKLFIVVSTRSPSPSYETIDKITCASYIKGIEPIIVINKTDLRSAEEIKEIYTKTGIKVFEVCAKTGEGVKELYGEISGICAFAGASGVGKSSLMNALFPKLSLAVGNISEKNQRGKHTTRTVELFETENGFFADTPGFGLVDFEHFDFLTFEELPKSFPEFEKYLGNCRYTSCTHTKESDCAIVCAVENGEIAKSRHESYVEMYGVLKNKKQYK